MSSARIRFLQTVEYKNPGVPFVREGFAWAETYEVWRTQGWDGTPLDECFSTDKTLRVDPYYGPVPLFEERTIEEDDRMRLYYNHEGILLRELKEHSDTSMPQFVRFPVESTADFETLASERLGLNRPSRFSDTWRAKLAAAENGELPRMCWADRWGGFFGPLRNLMGLENLSFAFYDQPDLIRRMMEQSAESIIAITDELLKYTEIDTFWFWEDMAFNHGSLIDPKLFRELAQPHYRRVCDWLRSRGIEHIWLDSDGDIHELIPIWLDSGINGLWPFEVQAGMDVVEIRRQYGRDLRMGGGIDKKAIVKGGEEMKREIDRIMPVVEDGGYLPELDHGAPPDISWPRYCEYMTYLLHRLGRG